MASSLLFLYTSCGHVYTMQLYNDAVVYNVVLVTVQF